MNAMIADPGFDLFGPPLGLRTPEAIRFTHFIVHIVDRETGKLEKSDLETPLDEAFPAELFLGHVTEAVTSSNHRLARFRSPKGKVAVAAMKSRAGASFVSASRDIADHFFAVMNSSPYRGGPFEIKPGDLVVAELEKVGAKTDERYLAILKIDPLDAVVRRIRTAGGQSQVVFEKAAAIIPTAKGTEVHKIALVVANQTGPIPFDLVVLDSNLPRKKVARFFYGDFLESELLRGSDETTEILREEIRDFLARLEPGERLTVLHAADEVLEAGEALTLSAFVERSLRLPGRGADEIQALREELLLRFQKRPKTEDRIGPADSVLPSPVTAGRLAEEVVIRLDQGMTINVGRDGMKTLMAAGRFEIAPELDADELVKITIWSGDFLL